jgi:hypothetical protein
MNLRANEATHTTENTAQLVQIRDNCITAILPTPPGSTTTTSIIVVLANPSIPQTCPAGTTLALILSVSTSGIPVGTPSTATSVYVVPIPTPTPT